MPYAGAAIKGNYRSNSNQKCIGRYFGAYASYWYLPSTGEKDVGDDGQVIENIEDLLFREE